MSRTRVAVIVGGRSSEHSISCLSGRSIAAAMDPARYDVEVVGIRRDGTWVQAVDRGWEIVEHVGALPQVADDAPTVDLVSCLDVDVVFPVLHGPWGEDGSVQGLFETLGVPFVGSGVLASALAMDKAHMKATFAHAGLQVPRWFAFTERQWRTDRDWVIGEAEGLGLPLFVKPCRAGSSLGIVKVHDFERFNAAVEEARRHDPRVIVEAGIGGVREIECGVLVDADGVARASRCAEIIVGAGHEFYDYEAKYLDDSATLVVPAELPADVDAEIGRLAVLAFEALSCDGLARVDFFLSPDGTVVLNELNTMPGFTDISMYPRMWAATGVTYAELVERLIADALRTGVSLH